MSHLSFRSCTVCLKDVMVSYIEACCQTTSPDLKPLGLLWPTSRCKITSCNVLLCAQVQLGVYGGASGPRGQRGRAEAGTRLFPRAPQECPSTRTWIQLGGLALKTLPTLQNLWCTLHQRGQSQGQMQNQTMHHQVTPNDYPHCTLHVRHPACLLSLRLGKLSTATVLH